MASTNLVLFRQSTRVWDSASRGGRGYSAHMQLDGNFVLYDRKGQATWSSGTWGYPGARLRLQNDGNLVVYDGQRALWASNTVLPTPGRCKTMNKHEGLGVGNALTSCNGFHRLTMQSDGNLVLYRAFGRASWATNTAGTSGYFATFQPDGNLVVYNRDDAALCIPGRMAGGRRESRFKTMGTWSFMRIPEPRSGRRAPTCLRRRAVVSCSRIGR